MSQLLVVPTRGFLVLTPKHTKSAFVLVEAMTDLRPKKKVSTDN